MLEHTHVHTRIPMYPVLYLNLYCKPVANIHIDIYIYICMCVFSCVYVYLCCVYVWVYLCTQVIIVRPMYIVTPLFLLIYVCMHSCCLLCIVIIVYSLVSWLLCVFAFSACVNSCLFVSIHVTTWTYIYTRRFICVCVCDNDVFVNKCLCIYQVMYLYLLFMCIYTFVVFFASRL